MEIKSGKRKRLNKNKKKNWKHVDIQDVEDHLEDIRLQERTGGVAAEKPDEALFFVDKDAEDEPVVAKKNKKDPKALRCYANLEQNPNVKAIRISTVPQQKVKPRNDQSPTRKEKLALKQSQVDRAKKQTSKSEEGDTTVKFDMWAEDSSKTKKDKNEYLPALMKPKPKAPARLRKKTSTLPAVELPHPGQSVNPTYEDHQDLLGKAHGVEVVKDKKAKKLYRGLQAFFPEKALTEEDYIKEMSGGLFEDEEENEEDEEQDGDMISANPPVRRENQKTTAQRNKEKRVKEHLAKIAERKELKKREVEFSRLGTLRKEVRKRERQLQEKKEMKLKLSQESKDKTKKLGKLKYEEPDLEVKLSDELVGSLREVKPEGHIIMDRWKSLQKRNILEPRERAFHKRKFKKITYVKRSHREEHQPPRGKGKGKKK